MRASIAISILTLAILACAVGMAGAGTTPSPSSVSPQPTMRIDIIALTPTRTVTITASEGMRLRDRPDAAGPGDSIELAIMKPGDRFQAESCRYVAGNWWAFGTYVSRETLKGWANAEFLSPNPCV